jgi:tetratricopeptide (TPR) repeat protein
MKAEHRKESPTQAVRHHVSRWVKEFKARPSTASIIFWLVVVAAVAIGVGWHFISLRETERTSATWLKFDQSSKPEDLEALAREHPGTPAAMAADFERARLLLRQGLDKYAASDEKERTEAQEKLQQAGDLYGKLATAARTFPLLVQEALRGAAKAHESRGELDEALKYYKQLKDAKPETEVTRAAADAVKSLDDADTKKKLEAFYADLKQMTSAKAPPPPEKP